MTREQYSPMAETTGCEQLLSTELGCYPMCARTQWALTGRCANYCSDFVPCLRRTICEPPSVIIETTATPSILVGACAVLGLLLVTVCCFLLFIICNKDVGRWFVRSFSVGTTVASKQEPTCRKTRQIPTGGNCTKEEINPIREFAEDELSLTVSDHHGHGCGVSNLRATVFSSHASHSHSNTQTRHPLLSVAGPSTPLLVTSTGTYNNTCFDGASKGPIHIVMSSSSTLNTVDCHQPRP